MDNKYEIETTNYSELEMLCESYDYIQGISKNENGEAVYKIFQYDIGADHFGYNY